MLFVSWELCNQSRCLKQSRKRPLWIRENLVHSIFFLYVCMRRGGMTTKQIYCSLYAMRRRLKGDTAMAPVLVKKISDRLAPFKWRLNVGDKRACAAVTDATIASNRRAYASRSPRRRVFDRVSAGRLKLMVAAQRWGKARATQGQKEKYHTLLMSAPAPKLLFLITFPCDIICCEIVYAWGTFSSCQLKSIWTNQYLSILWHTHSWPLGKSCLK